MGLSETLGFAPSVNAYRELPPVPISHPVAKVNADPVKKFSHEQEQILKLLADGFLPVTIASTLGITESAISQHLANEDFKRELAARKQVTLGKYKELDDGYDRIEAKLLKQLETQTMIFARPGEIVSMLEKINKMKRRIGASDSNAASQQVSQIVNISMPTVIVRQLQVTKEGKVVSVDGQSIVTIPSHTLNNLATEVVENEPASQKALAGPR